MKELTLDCSTVEGKDLQVLEELYTYLEPFLYPSHVIAPGEEEYVEELRRNCYEELRFAIGVLCDEVVCPFTRNLLTELEQAVECENLGRFYEIVFLIRKAVEGSRCNHKATSLDTAYTLPYFLKVRR